MPNRSPYRCLSPLALLLALAATPLPLCAQGGDPAREIQEIARRVDEQLREIDRLLLESGKKGQGRSVPKDLLQQAKQRGEAVEQGIDELIEKLSQMKDQNSSSSSSSGEQSQQNRPQDQQQSSQDQQRQGRQQRRENQTPDFVQQPREPGQEQGEQPGQPQPGQPQPGQNQPGQNQPGGQQPGQEQRQPEGGEAGRDPGQNQRGNQPPENATGPGQPGTGDGSWGELQSYVNFLKNRGTTPKVPEKYRKYWEAYLKSKPAGAGGK